MQIKKTVKSSCSESPQAPDVYASKFNLIGKDKLRDTQRLSPICLSAVLRRES